MEIGIYTFGELTPDMQTGQLMEPSQRITNLVEEAVLADQVGLDMFALGEHHRPDYLVSAPAVVLGAAAVKTKNIRLSSAVTVLSSDDPVRVFQNFATIDLLSRGRAEIMAGRGSFIESFPLFGYDLNDYDSLFTEKLELLLQIISKERITWSGKHRASLKNQAVYPRPFQKELPVWIGVGGTPESVVRAADHGLPMALAIIGGQPARFVPYARLYRERGAQKGFKELKLGINAHGFIAENSQDAAKEFYPPYAFVMSQLGRERGWPPMDAQQFQAMRAREGALLVGSPQEVIDKILYHHELFKHDRFLMQMSVGTLPHAKLMRSIELLGTVVAPAVRKHLAASNTNNQPH